MRSVVMPTHSLQQVAQNTGNVQAVPSPSSLYESHHPFHPFRSLFMAWPQLPILSYSLKMTLPLFLSLFVFLSLSLTLFRCIPPAPHLTSGTEAVFAVSHVLSLVGDEATRAEGVTLLPVGGKWSALALECVGVCSSGLRLTPEEEPSMDEVTDVAHCLFSPALSLFLLCPALSYPILSYPILSYPILSYPILSYPILPCPVLLCANMSCTTPCCMRF